MDDHFDIGRVFEIGKFDITRLTCISMRQFFGMYKNYAVMYIVFHNNGNAYD